jgi:hypothetical protein
MVRDCLGNALSATSPGTLQAVDDFVAGFLAYETRAERIVRAADEAEGCCIANVYAGFLWMLLEAPTAPVRAAPYLAAAERTASEATRREQLNVEVLRAWIADEVPRALSACAQLTDEYPRDLVILKIEQYLEFNRGDFPAMLRAALKVQGHNADVAYVHGMAAFAYEECQLLGEAERAARRWQELADHLAARAEDTVQPFLTLQYLYGLARAERDEARALLEAVRRRTESAPAHAREVWREVALPAGEGLLAYACRDYDRAWRELCRAMPRMIEAGGSHAQRDFFEQILLDAAIESGRLTPAQQMLELRRAADPEGVPVNSALAHVYARLGLATLADEARGRAAATRARHPE